VIFLWLLAAQACEEACNVGELTLTESNEQFVETTKAQINARVEVSLKLSNFGADTIIQEAFRRAAAILQAINNSLAGFQTIEKLATTSAAINPDYNFSDGEQRLVGYTASSTLRFRSSIDEAQNIIPAIVNAGGLLDSIQFVATPTAIERSQREATARALRKLKASVSMIMSELEVCLLTYKTVSTSVTGGAMPPPVPIPFDRQMAAAPGSGGVMPLSGGEQSIIATATATVRYGPCTDATASNQDASSQDDSSQDASSQGASSRRGGSRGGSAPRRGGSRGGSIGSTGGTV
jgi:uncharacterized protein YggE